MIPVSQAWLKMLLRGHRHQLSARRIHKVFLLVIAGVLIVVYQNCNKMNFDGSESLSSSVGGGGAGQATVSKVLSPAVLTGVMGGADAVPDDVLTDLSSPSIIWQLAEGAVTYKISVYDANNVAEVCAEQTLEDSSVVYGKDSNCTLVDGSNYTVRLSSFDNLGVGVKTPPYVFSVNLSALPKKPPPPVQKVASCQTINVVEIETVMPIQTVVVPQLQPDALGRYPVIPYAGDAVTVNRLCKDLGCGDYVTSSGRGYTSPSNNNVVRYNATSSSYEVYPARWLNNKIQTLACTPFNTVKILANCNGGFCETGKLVTRNGVTVTLDAAVELRNANKLCQDAGYPSAYGLWFDSGSAYWAMNRPTYSWNTTTSAWVKQPLCQECLVSNEVICRKN